MLQLAILQFFFLVFVVSLFRIEAELVEYGFSELEQATTCFHSKLAYDRQQIRKVIVVKVIFELGVGLDDALVLVVGAAGTVSRQAWRVEERSQRAVYLHQYVVFVFLQLIEVFAILAVCDNLVLVFAQLLEVLHMLYVAPF